MTAKLRTFKSEIDQQMMVELRGDLGILFTGDAGGAVDEDEDHAAEGPGDAEEADAVAGAGLLLVADDGGDSDVEEEEGGDELRDQGSVEGPLLQLHHVDQGRRWRVNVVLPALSLLAQYFLRHLLTLSLSLDCLLSVELEKQGCLSFSKSGVRVQGSVI